MQTSVKTCFKCGKEKSLDEFYTHPRMKDGHLGKCKECTCRGEEPMTAQDWLDELERLREAATPGPWDVNQKNLTVYDNYGDSVCDTQQTHNAQNNLAYIVAACNAVPRLIKMLKLEACLLECPYEDEKCPYDEDNTVSCAHCKVQRLYELTEPTE